MESQQINSDRLRYCSAACNSQTYALSAPDSGRFEDRKEGSRFELVSGGSEVEPGSRVPDRFRSDLGRLSAKKHSAVMQVFCH